MRICALMTPISSVSSVNSVRGILWLRPQAAPSALRETCSQENNMIRDSVTGDMKS
jgi:hypothetical protein